MKPDLSSDLRLRGVIFVCWKVTPAGSSAPTEVQDGGLDGAPSVICITMIVKLVDRVLSKAEVLHTSKMSFVAPTSGIAGSRGRC